jgi:hypothetical protein
MKKNPLSEIYESKILTSEAVPSDKVKSPKDLDIESNVKAETIKGQGPEGCKSSVDTPEEDKENSQTKNMKVENQNIEGTEAPSYEGAFEKLFKKTLTEEFNDIATDMAADVEVPTSDEEMADELESDTDEVSDLVSDLKSVMDHLQNILDKISEETNSEEDNKEEGSEESESEESKEKDYSEFEESVDAKELGHPLHNLKAGTDLTSKAKGEVKGAVKTSKGKADGGDVESDPDVKPAKAHDKACQNPKGKPEVKSTVKKGEFFK